MQLLFSHCVVSHSAHLAPLSVAFSGQGYWSGLPFPSAGDLPDPGIEPVSPVTPALQVESLLLSHQGSPRELLRGLNEALSLLGTLAI